MRYIDLDVILGSRKDNEIFFSAKHFYIAINFNFKLNLTMIPNPNTNKKIYLSNLEYILLNTHVEYSDQHVGTR